MVAALASLNFGNIHVLYQTTLGQFPSQLPNLHIAMPTDTTPKQLMHSMGQYQKVMKRGEVAAHARRQLDDEDPAVRFDSN